MPSTRKNRSSGLMGRLWSPFGHTAAAASNSVGAVANTAKGVVSVTARGVNRVGRSITGHFNAAVGDLVKGTRSRRNRKQAGGKNRKTNSRKNRKTNSRKNRKTNSRKNRTY
jgi:hypothetical protein